MDTIVTIPYGDWIAQALTYFGGLLAIILGVYIRKLAVYLPDWIEVSMRDKMIGQVEQLLDNAIGFGVNAVKGAATDRTLNVELGSEVLSKAVQYAVNRAPTKTIDWVGGEEALRKMIFARLNLGADVSAANLKVIP